MASTASPPRNPRSSLRSLRPSTSPAAPPPSIPLPPLPPPPFALPALPSSSSSSTSAAANRSSKSPQLPPLPPLPALSTPAYPSLIHGQLEKGSTSPASSASFTDRDSGFTIATTVSTAASSTRPSSAHSLPPSSKPAFPPPPVDPPSPPPAVRQRLERARSVTAEGIDFDLVTPHLGPGASTSPPDTPTADGEAATPRAEEEPDCGCDAPLPAEVVAQLAALSDGEYASGEDDDEYDEEAERLLSEAGLGGLGLGLLRRQSEAVFLARIANGGRAPTPLSGGGASVGWADDDAGAGEGAKVKRSTTPPGPPPPPALGGTVTLPARLHRRRQGAGVDRSSRRRSLFGLQGLQGLSLSGTSGDDTDGGATSGGEGRRRRKEKGKKGEKRRSKEPFDRFSLPEKEAIEAARRCELLGEGGGSVTFDQLLRERKKKVVVVFLRHAWCGLCQQFVEALTRSTQNLAAITSSSRPSMSGSRASSDSGATETTSDGDGPTIPPLYVLLISNGSAALIPTYRKRLDCPFPLYMDRRRTLYKALGMTMKTWDMGKESEKGSYIVKSNMGNIIASTKSGIAMPHYPGSQTQLGGEFVFEYDDEADEVRCCYAARMHTTRAHSEIRDLFAAAGVHLNEDDAASVYGDR
ncbi:hypothetical protein JCM10207_002609 [Rhodosporidiobolus poonsookiae]